MPKDLRNTPGFIYKITSPNNKIYIGQTVNVRKRLLYYNTPNFKQQTKLWRSCVKYNWKPSDTFTVIEECLCGTNKENLNAREMYWIAYYNSFKKGLNCNEGGSGNVGHVPTEETRKKMSQSQLGVKHTEERNRKKSEYTKGRKHTEEAKKKMSDVKRKRMNDEIKEKIRVGLTGNKNGVGNAGTPKKVVCITTGQVYKSLKAAADDLGLCSSNITAVCKGKMQQIKGYKFKYYEEKTSGSNGGGD